MPDTPVSPPAIAVFDGRPFFEKALQFGMQQGLLTPEKLQALCAEAPKGMVQIARYFGTEYLRPELELAKQRIVNLVSVYLEHSSGGDLRRAAESLRDHSLLSRSKGGADLLKALITMPQNTHFGMMERGSFSDKHIPLLAQWSLKSYADYQAEWTKRNAVAATVEAALWLADYLGLDADTLDELAPDAEAVIRTAILVLACQRSDMPDWVTFEKIIRSLRNKKQLQWQLPPDFPTALHSSVHNVAHSVEADLPKILDAQVTARKLFCQTLAFTGRYFWIEDGLSEVEEFDRTVSQAWQKFTGGHTDDSSLLTLFLLSAAGSTPKPVITDKAAATLVRKIRKSGLQPHLATDFIEAHAPAAFQNAYLQLWNTFLEEARPTLLSDRDDTLRDALNLVRRECNVTG
jgi:hypothetical protein